MSGEPIGTVELAHCQDVVRVMVYGGEVSVQFSTSDGRQLPGGSYLTVDECAKVAELITKAARIAPIIQVAQDTCRRIVMDAEADYERIVADAIGGAR